MRITQIRDSAEESYHLNHITEFMSVVGDGRAFACNGTLTRPILGGTAYDKRSAELSS